MQEHPSTRDSEPKNNPIPGVVKQTPMLKQYLEVKRAYPDCLLFFRLGDFFEMFFEDAEVASKILDLTLTSRSKGEDAYPMCGVPFFAANNYIAKLVDQGFKVAVCDQVEDPKLAKGIVRREVTRVVTPGMITNPEDLDHRESNFLAGVLAEEGTGDGPSGLLGIAFLDVSTADFRMTEVSSVAALLDELSRIRPRELVLPAGMEQGEIHRLLEKKQKDVFFRFLDGSAVGADQEDFRKFPEVTGAAADQADAAGVALATARMVFHYAGSLLKSELAHIRRVVYYQVSDHLIIDDNSLANLEILRTQMEGKRKGSLLGFLDRTRTPMGARLLGQWVLYPLVRPAPIHERHNAVQQLVEDQVLRSDLEGQLGEIRDLERLLAKISVGQANPRDLGVLRDSLKILPEWAALVAYPDFPLGQLIGRVDVVEDLFQYLNTVLVESPPVSLDEGGAIRPGFSRALDQLVDLSTRGRDFIARLEQEERKKTGIGSLKIRFNRVFGYYIEVTKPNLALVPAHYRRKQTTANAERFETEELKQQEEAILRAQEDRVQLEREIVAQILEKIRAEAARILRVAAQVAATDVVASLAKVAASHGYCRPVVDEGEALEIVDGRHPVVEQALTGERFVPNDIRVDCEKEQMLLITGPNMAGKSTVIRQAALIALLAQMGSFVPASSARVGIVDRIFTRIGAADNLARGQSTFMVEMVETALILRHATRHSLLILDEIGRGTSTFDGVSIAWAVAEYIHDCIGARTLFATHYHQLTDLALTKKRVVNYTISIKEWKEQIIFLRRLIKGVCNRSYGIQVGRLAGLPEEVLLRAQEILANLEGEEYDEVGTPRLSRARKKAAASAGQLSLFVPAPRSLLEEELSKVDLSCITPLEALQTLYRMKGEK